MKIEVESGVFEKELKLMAEKIGPNFEQKLNDVAAITAAIKSSKIYLTSGGTLKVKIPVKFDRSKISQLYTAVLAMFSPVLAEVAKDFGKFDILIEE